MCLNENKKSINIYKIKLKEYKLCVINIFSSC
jgi:hypothetical protein